MVPNLQYSNTTQGRKLVELDVQIVIVYLLYLMLIPLFTSYGILLLCYNTPSHENHSSLTFVWKYL